MTELQSTKEFPEALRLLMQLEGVSERGLSKRIQQRGYEMSHSNLHRIYKGAFPIILDSEETQGTNPSTLEAIAAALHVAPEFFAEYRLWKARRRFNPKADGWEQAIENLRELEAEGGK